MDDFFFRYSIWRGFVKRNTIGLIRNRNEMSIRDLNAGLKIWQRRQDGNNGNLLLSKS